MSKCKCGKNDFTIENDYLHEKCRKCGLIRKREQSVCIADYDD